MARKVPERPIFPSSVPSSPVRLAETVRAILGQLTTMLAETNFRLNRSLPTDGDEAMENPLPLQILTVATLPPAANWTGALVFVSDGAAGAKFRGSDGTTWLSLG